METVSIMLAKDHLSASSAKALLESNGIICLFPNEYFTGVYPNYSIISGGYRLYVSINDVEAANEILEPHRKAFETLKQQEQSKSEERCPLCKTNDVDVIYSKRFFTQLFFALFGSFQGLTKRHFKQCNYCGHKWK